MPSLAPAPLLVAAALLMLLLPRRLAGWLALAGTAAAAACAYVQGGAPATVHFAGDSFCLGGPAVWHRPIAVALLAIACVHRRATSRLAHAGLLLAGAGLLGAMGNLHLLSWFLWMSLAALGATGLVLDHRATLSYRAAFRGLVWLVVAGFLVVCGAVMRYVHTHDWSLTAPEALHHAQGWVLLVGLLIFAAAPLVHAWLLALVGHARSTAAAVLLLLPLPAAALLAQAYAPTAQSLLFALGLAQTLVGLLYAALADDVRRVLAYGCMAAMGIALTASAWLGAEAPAAMASLLGAQGLALVALYLVAAQVTERVGPTTLSRLGGLGRQLPVVAGAGALAAWALGGGFPFVTSHAATSLLTDRLAAGSELTPWRWLPFGMAAALFAVVGLKTWAGLFLGEDKGWRPARRTDALARIGLAIALVGIVVESTAEDAAAGGWRFVDLGPLVVTAATLASAGFVFSLARRSLIPRFPRGEPLDADELWAGLASGLKGLVTGPLLRLFEALSRFAHETVPGILWAAAKNPRGALMLLWRRIRLAGAGLLGSRAALDRQTLALARDQARYDAEPGAGAYPIGSIVLFAALIFVVYLVVELF